MGTGYLTHAARLPAPADAELGIYLRTLQSRLPLPAAQRHRILAETGDGLASSIETLLAQGMAPAEAARAAIAEFGCPRMLAHQFTAVIAPAIARRTGLSLVLTGPLVGLAWAAALGDGSGWTERISSLLHAMPYVIGLLTMTVPAAVLAVGSAGMALRHRLSTPISSWLSIRLSSRLPVTAAWVATLGCLAADTALLTRAAIEHSHSSVSVAVAVAFSGIRLALTAIAFRRLSRLRAAGY